MIKAFLLGKETLGKEKEKVYGKMDCPFCNIDHKKTRILKEYDSARVIFSNPRLMPGHLLVIPKRHIEKPADMTDEERKELFNTVLEFQNKILGNKINFGLFTC